MAKKKHFNWLSYLPVATLGMGLLIGGVRFQLQAEQTKSKVEKIENKVDDLEKEGDKEIKDLKDENKDLERKVEVNKTQQDNIQAQVQQVSEKTDKIYDLLLEIKKKK